MACQANLNGVFGDDRHLDGLPEELPSGEPGRVREAIRATIENTVVGTDETLTLDVKPAGLLEARTAIPHSGCRGPEPMGIITWKHEVLVVPLSGKWVA